MNILIVYETLYGNTEKIAQAVQEGIGSTHTVRCIKAADAKPDDLEQIDFLIIGSPTHGGWYSQDTKTFFVSIPENSLQNLPAAAFDTGTTKEGEGFFTRAIINLFGYAASRMAKELIQKGVRLIAAETFFVHGKEGPLKAGEIERARTWASSLMQKVLN